MSDKFLTPPDLPPYPWLEIINPQVRLGQVRHALFDFDGTISVIRRGWEAIMIALMVEMICEGQLQPVGLEGDVAAYVDRSTGILTIEQMRWLEEAVRRYGLAQHPRTAREYKRIYNDRMLRPVRARLAQLESAGDPAATDTLTIAGVRSFLEGLYERGVTLYLASGTDHVFVQEEASALGVSEFFGPHIYGARDESQEDSKERIIQRILTEHELRGAELLVVGDGPVEIFHARSQAAIALGVAADEDQRQGLDPRKRARLLAAGADLIITDFSHCQELLAMFTQELTDF
ncbi:MAG: HAD family hydrolase [Anaerolineae bacterium]|nr:HAD family hydrolase [Anaerolineae bacterium]